MQKIDKTDKTVGADDPDDPVDLLQPYSYSDQEPDRDHEEREAIMEIDGRLDMPDFLRRT